MGLGINALYCSLNRVFGSHQPFLLFDTVHEQLWLAATHCSVFLDWGSGWGLRASGASPQHLRVATITMLLCPGPHRALACSVLRGGGAHRSGHLLVLDTLGPGAATWRPARWALGLAAPRCAVPLPTQAPPNV